MAQKPEILENDDVKKDAEIASEGDDKTVNEGLLSIFGDDITEEFKEKVSTLFEAAMNDRLTAEKTRLQEEKDSEIAALKAELTEQVDTYMTYVVEQWMKDNQVAIDNQLRADISENFISGLKTLFAENYIEVPEDKINLVDDMASHVVELEDKLNEAIAENIEMKKMINEAQMEAVFDEVSEGLADTQAEKLKVLIEGIAFDDVDSYRKKVEIVKENYFSDKKQTGTNLVEDEQAGIDPESESGKTALKSTDPVVNRYVEAISKTLKK
jgi:hypothetical protein